jgi:hypothetical protein
MQRAAIATFCAVLLLGAMTVVINYPNAVVARAPKTDVGNAPPIVVANAPRAKADTTPPAIAAIAPQIPQALPDDDDDDDDTIDNVPISAALPIQEGLDLSWIEIAVPGLAKAIEPSPGRRATMEQICATLASVAAAHDLPLPFFVRLIWQESRFRTDAVSRAGARGIAQFMPGTARERGLTDPNDPIQSLHASAGFLSDLRKQFGNIGLAAAAYNGGPGRVQGWLNGRKSLPRETRNYVRIITGAPAEKWKGDRITAVQAPTIPEEVPCPTLLSSPHEEEPDAEDESGVTASVDTQPDANAPSPAAAPAADTGWSVVLTGRFTKRAAQAKATRLKGKFRTVLNGREPTVVGTGPTGRRRARMSQIRIPDQDRASAEQLCARLRARGERCAVVRES